MLFVDHFYKKENNSGPKTKNCVTPTSILSLKLRNCFSSVKSNSINLSLFPLTLIYYRSGFPKFIFKWPPLKKFKMLCPSCTNITQKLP